MSPGSSWFLPRPLPVSGFRLSGGSALHARLVHRTLSFRLSAYPIAAVANYAVQRSAPGIIAGGLCGIRQIHQGLRASQSHFKILV